MGADAVAMVSVTMVVTMAFPLASTSFVLDAMAMGASGVVVAGLRRLCVAPRAGEERRSGYEEA